MIYDAESGERLFDGSFDADDTQHLSSGIKSKQNLRLWVPEYYYCEDFDHCPTRSLSSPQRIHLGFFGPGAFGKTMNFKTTPGDLSYKYSGATGSSFVRWEPFSSSDSLVHLENANGGTRGGEAGDCGNEYFGCMDVDPTSS